jgi:hypothetical protein
VSSQKRVDFKHAFLPSAITVFLLSVVCALIGSEARAENTSKIIAQSGPDRVTLVELYSSEGCDSCPPADKWFSTLKNKPGLWKQFVPLAFQVDYWDYLGWKDELAKTEFTERQRAHARELGSSGIYTPELISDGKEWGAWRTGGEPLTARALKNSGVLKVERTASGKFKVIYTPLLVAGAKNLSLHFAVIGMAVAHQVKSGENRGHELKHDFIVLDLKTRQGQSKNGSVEAEFESASTAGAAVGKSGSQPVQALAAWVTEPGELQALQATGAYLEN